MNSQTQQENGIVSDFARPVHEHGNANATSVRRSLVVFQGRVVASLQNLAAIVAQEYDLPVAQNRIGLIAVLDSVTPGFRDLADAAIDCVHHRDVDMPPGRTVPNSASTGMSETPL